MESMPTARDDLMCGPVRSQPGGPVEKIVVAGGYGGLATVEVYNVKENFWETADDLPFGGLRGAAVIPFEDTFIIIGGSQVDNSGKLWKYNKIGKWEEMPEKMSERKETSGEMATLYLRLIFTAWRQNNHTCQVWSHLSHFVQVFICGQT